MKKKTCFLIYVETRQRIWRFFFQNKKPDVTDNCEIINKFTSDSESSYTYSSIPLIFLDFAFRIVCNNSEKKKKTIDMQETGCSVHVTHEGRQAIEVC